MEHYCSEHGTKFYENHKGDKSWWSHKIAGTDKYCNEAKKQVSATPPAVDNGQKSSEIFPEEKPKLKEPDYKSPVNRSISLSYAKDLCVGGKIEVKDLIVYADKFLGYMEKGE